MKKLAMLFKYKIWTSFRRCGYKYNSDKILKVCCNLLNDFHDSDNAKKLSIWKCFRSGASYVTTYTIWTIIIHFTSQAQLIIMHYKVVSWMYFWKPCRFLCQSPLLHSYLSISTYVLLHLIIYYQYRLWPSSTKCTCDFETCILKMFKIHTWVIFNGNLD